MLALMRNRLRLALICSCIPFIRRYGINLHRSPLALPEVERILASAQPEKDLRDVLQPPDRGTGLNARCHRTACASPICPESRRSKSVVALPSWAASKRKLKTLLQRKKSWIGAKAVKFRLYPHEYQAVRAIGKSFFQPIHRLLVVA